MTGLGGLLFALAFLLWVWPWLLCAAAAGFVVWLLKRWADRYTARLHAEWANQRRLRADCDRQHSMVLAGDPRGIYGTLRNRGNRPVS